MYTWYVTREQISCRSRADLPRSAEICRDLPRSAVWAGHRRRGRTHAHAWDAQAARVVGMPRPLPTHACRCGCLDAKPTASTHHPAYFCKQPCSADASQLCGASAQVWHPGRSGRSTTLSAPGEIHLFVGPSDSPCDLVITPCWPAPGSSAQTPPLSAGYHPLVTWLPPLVRVKYPHATS